VESYKKLLQFFQLPRAALEVKLLGCLYESFVKNLPLQQLKTVCAAWCHKMCGIVPEMCSIMPKNASLIARMCGMMPKICGKVPKMCSMLPKMCGMVPCYH
jgi:hypothetical protein